MLHDHDERSLLRRLYRAAFVKLRISFAAQCLFYWSQVDLRIRVLCVTTQYFLKHT